jgi:hypothetical protein
MESNFESTFTLLFPLLSRLYTPPSLLRSSEGRTSGILLQQVVTHGKVGDPVSQQGKAPVRHEYPWVPTDWAHGRPRQVGSAYQKTCQPVSGPNRPSWRPTRPSEDIPEDSPDDLIQYDLKTWCTRQDIGGFRPKQNDRIWQAM